MRISGSFCTEQQLRHWEVCKITKQQELLEVACAVEKSLGYLCSQRVDWTMETEDWNIHETLHTVTDLNDFVDLHKGELLYIHMIKFISSSFEKVSTVQVRGEDFKIPLDVIRTTLHV